MDTLQLETVMYRRSCTMLCLILILAVPLEAQDTAAVKAYTKRDSTDAQTIYNNTRNSTLRYLARRIQARSDSINRALRGVVGPTPASTTVSTITMSAGSTSLVVGGSTTVTAIPKTSTGAPLLTPVSFSSSPSSVGSVSGTGVVSTVGAGTLTVMAQADTVIRSLAITVTTPPPPPPPDTSVITTTTFGPATRAELPRVTPSTTFPAPLRRITVPAGSNLQATIDAASCGDVLLLAPGATYTVNLWTPNKPCTDGAWITIQTNLTDAQIGARGVRMTPTKAGQLAKLITTSAVNEPLMSTTPFSNHFRFYGVEMAVASSVGTLNSLIRIGPSDIINTAANQPHHFAFDHIYAHGNATTQLTRCITGNGATIIVVDSWLGDCHGNGGDSQAYGQWNGSGPVLIENNHLEGGHEGIIFGGGSYTISQGGSPSDITVRRNHFFRPKTWKGVWQAKNCFETKHVKRLLVEGNVVENNWEDAQAGFCFLLKSTDQENDTPWSQTADVTVQYNKIICTGSGTNIAGRYSDDGNYPAAARITFHDNIISQINTGVCTASGIASQFLNGAQDVAYYDNTLLNNGTYANSAITFDGNPQVRFAYVNNVAFNGQYGINGSGANGPAALTKFGPSGLFSYDLLVGGNCTGFPSTFVCPSSLPSTFPAGYNGLTIGADIAKIEQMTAGVVVTDGLALRRRIVRAVDTGWKPTAPVDREGSPEWIAAQRRKALRR